MEKQSILDDILYDTLRNKLIKKMITNIGKIKEEKDKIICYVEPKKFQRKFKKKYLVELYLNGMNAMNIDLRKIIEKLKLNKPVYYIFENIEFKHTLEIGSLLGTNTHIVFRNCTFKRNIIINYADIITFENNKYYDHGAIGYRTADTFLYHKYGMIKNLRIINDNFINLDVEHHPAMFGMNLKIDNLEIINSNIKVDNSLIRDSKEYIPNRGGLNITANKTTIINSTIDVAEFYLDSKDITIDETSRITASNGMIIENGNNNLETNSSNISTPYLVYNGVKLIDSKNKVLAINKEKVELQKSRASLVTTLKKIEQESNNINEEILNKVRNKINSKPLKKVLQKQSSRVNK